MNKNSIGKATYSVHELADSLGIGLNKAYELVNRDDFPKIRLGKRFLIPIDPLNRWLEAQALGGREV